MTRSESTERALLISHLHDQFWSEEYYRAAELVRRWRGGGGGDWAGELFNELDRLSALPEERRRLVERTNAARRLIKSYFRKTHQFCRLKIGIGALPAGEEAQDYVLRVFSQDEWSCVENVLDRAVAALECLMVDGVDAAMNRFNVREPVG